LIVDGKTFAVADLQAKLLVESPGQSIAYVTDFLLDSATHDRLSSWLSGCNILICEAQYRHDDDELAERNYHATTSRVASLAKAAEVDQLLLFHLSGRSSVAEWQAMLEESRKIFPRLDFRPVGVLIELAAQSATPIGNRRCPSQVWPCYCSTAGGATICNFSINCFIAWAEFCLTDCNM